MYNSPIINSSVVSGRGNVFIAWLALNQIGGHQRIGLSEPGNPSVRSTGKRKDQSRKDSLLNVLWDSRHCKVWLILIFNAFAHNLCQSRVSQETNAERTGLRMALLFCPSLMNPDTPLMLACPSLEPGLEKPFLEERLCQISCKGFYPPWLAFRLGKLGDQDSLHCIYKV